jgi:Glycosyltransferase family 87
MTIGRRRRLPLVALVIVLIAELPLLIPPPFALTDHLVFWEAGRIVVNGASPYDMTIWTDVARSYQSGHLLPFIDAARPIWIYPAWTAFLFVPFGLLPYPIGPWALYFAYLAVGLFAAVLFIRSLPARWQPPAELSIVIAAAFQPLLIADRYGQFGSFLLLGLVLVYRGLRDRSVAQLIAGALLLLMKPQLFLVVAALVVWWLLKRRDHRSSIAVSASLLLVMAATTLRYPESLGFFRGGVDERVGVYFSWYSSTWAFAQFFVGPWWPIAGSILVVMTVLVCAAAVRSLPQDLRDAGLFASAAILSLAITPVDFHYDQAPLLLAVVIAVAIGRRPYQIALTWALAVVAPWFIFFIELGLGRQDSQSLSGVVPVLVALLFAVAASSSPATIASSPAIAKTPAKLK